MLIKSINKPINLFLHKPYYNFFGHLTIDSVVGDSELAPFPAGHVEAMDFAKMFKDGDDISSFHIKAYGMFGIDGVVCSEFQKDFLELGHDEAGELFLGKLTHLIGICVTQNG